MKPGTTATLDLLRRRGDAGLTALDALDAIGSFRLGARIWELRAAGYVVNSIIERTPSGKHVARYRLRERL